MHITSTLSSAIAVGVLATLATASTILPALGPSNCLTAASNADNAIAEIEPCNGGTGQQWTYSGGTLVVYGNKCLTVPGGSTANGVKLVVLTCASGNASQQWTYTGTAIQWTGQGNCLDATGGSVAAGNQVQTWGCSGGINQGWSISGASPPPASTTTHTTTTTASSPPPTGGATYNINANIAGSGFYSNFAFQAIGDPTNGRVNYVNQATAQSSNLTYANGNTFVMRADYTTTLSASGPGRNSVRLQSNAQWTTHALVLDIAHMPEGCGTWPAFWTVGANWPYGGEIDIIEGVNNEVPNVSTLHTGPGCTMPASGGVQTGPQKTTDCDAFDNGNAGCGVGGPTNSYGPPFNSNGGGWYAMERTNNYIKIWFWPRNAGNVPSDVRNGGNSVNTAGWGEPYADFVNTSCNFPNFFGPNNIVINLTFCGDWAGNSAVYSGSGCPSTCVDYVNNNPSAFTNAYFQFNGLRVYT